jgi:hypothetical protein
MSQLQIRRSTIKEPGVTLIAMAETMMPNIMAAPFISNRAGRLYRSMHPSRLLKKSASFVLASLRGSTYSGEYASPLRLLRPCWTAFLNSLRTVRGSSATPCTPRFPES